MSEPPLEKAHAQLERYQNLDDEETDSDKKLGGNGNTDFAVPILMAHSSNLSKN